LVNYPRRRRKRGSLVDCGSLAPEMGDKQLVGQGDVWL
jgi:hypothetical protein